MKYKGSVNIEKQKKSASRERLYAVYNGMIQRCYNPKTPNYFRYGGRGIKVCDEWRKSYESFKKWAYETGYDKDAPRGKCTIDRIDCDGNYEPNNCRWVDMVVQRSNQHPAYTFMERPKEKIVHIRSRTTFWEIDGVTKSAIEWCEIYGVTKQFADYRVKTIGMTPKDALTTPKANQGRGRTCEILGIKRKYKKRKQPATSPSKQVAPLNDISNDMQLDITTYMEQNQV